LPPLLPLAFEPLLQLAAVNASTITNIPNQNFLFAIVYSNQKIYTVLLSNGKLRTALGGISPLLAL